MNQQPSYLQPLALPRTKIVGEQAFDGDLLSRKKLAEQLTGYLDRLRVGAVLAIDARWGEGKTWFGRNWANLLENREHKVVFIDAFAQDYMEDPFLLIAAEIADALDNEKGAAKKFREKATGAMKTILPMGAKALINLAGRVALGSTNMSDDLQEVMKDASKDTSDETSKWIESKLKNYSQEKKSLEKFREEITKFAGDLDKPMVIFIDELDRCRPTFAVQLVERIKHFFDVPNLIFVLLLNREQLENSIKGVYGSETDAATYLGKFVHIFLRLPKSTSRNTYSHNHPIPAFIANVLNRYGFNSSQATLVDEFKNDLSQWVVTENMSLRDIERACALFVMSKASNGFISYLIMLKIKHPALYERLLRNELSAHEEAMVRLSPLIPHKMPNDMDWPENYFKTIQELHKLQLGGDPSTDAPCFIAKGAALVGFRAFNKENTFSNGFNRIDLPVETY